jgi:hypothetical protein
MADLRTLLEACGVSPERFLEAARSHEACKWRHGRDSDKDPDGYTIESFLWINVPPGDTPWSVIHSKWMDMEVRERWDELDRILGWLDPLEAELMEVGDEAT